MFFPRAATALATEIGKNNAQEKEEEEAKV